MCAKYKYIQENSNTRDSLVAMCQWRADNNCKIASIYPRYYAIFHVILNFEYGEQFVSEKLCNMSRGGARRRIRSKHSFSVLQPWFNPVYVF